MTQVEDQAVDLLASGEPRLLLACCPPAANLNQPLTLAALFELERVLFLITHMAQYNGSWHHMMPGSLAKFRTAVANFIGFVALLNTNRAFAPCCPPQSQAEHRLASTATGSFWTCCQRYTNY